MQRKSKMVDVAQSVRASDCGSEGRRFETDLPPRWNGELKFSSPFFYFFPVGKNGNSDENQVVSWAHSKKAVFRHKGCIGGR